MARIAVIGGSLGGLLAANCCIALATRFACLKKPAHRLTGGVRVL